MNAEYLILFLAVLYLIIGISQRGKIIRITKRRGKYSYLLKKP